MARLPDVIAERNGKTEYFEIKYTTKSSSDSYWGAATLSEWRVGPTISGSPLVCRGRENAGGWVFRLFSPAELLPYSRVPSFKFYLKIPAELTRMDRKGTQRVQCTREAILLLARQYEELLSC